MAPTASERLAIEQGVARGETASEIAAEVGVPVDVVHAVWDELDAAAAHVDEPRPAVRAVEEPLPIHSAAADGGRATPPEWFVDFRQAYLTLGSIELACLDSQLSVRAAEKRWARHHPADPMHAKLVHEVARQARLLRAVAVARGGVAA